MYVFVYGSLRQGEYNHRIAKECMADSHIEPAYMKGAVMYDLGGFPAIRKGEGVIQGELILVSESGLKRLDRLEGHPHFYCREEIEVYIVGAKVKAWVYWGPKDIEHEPIIKSGDWSRRYEEIN